LLFREKTKLAPAGDVTGTHLFSVLRNAWRAVASRSPVQSLQNHVSIFTSASFPASAQATRSLERDFGKQECPAELHGVIDVLRAVRRRILTNIFLQGSAKWWSWVLIGLIAVAAISVKMAGVLILAAILAAGGTAFILTWVWRTRPSMYDSACRLDSAAGLHDRVSTALFLCDVENPDEMIRHQRQDALARLVKVEPRGLFPIRVPVTASRALVLILAAGGLLAYRVNHKPPLVSLLQSTARSQLVQSILSPIVHAMEKDLQRTMALANKPETPADEVRAGDVTPPPDDLWQNGDDKQNNPGDGQQADPGGEDQSQDQTPQGGNQNGSQSADSQQQQSGGQQSQESKNVTGSTSQSGQQQESKQSDDKNPSLGQSLMQALKNMMSNSQNQQSNNKGNQDSQQSNSQGAPQSGNANSSDAKNESGQKGDSRGSSEAQQKASQSTSNGAGSQKGLKQTRTDFDSHPVTAVPDRVPLEATNYKEQIRMRMQTEAGTAQLATRDVSPQGQAVVNGAEQENIPARYRMYVQHYFEHTENAQPDSVPQGNAQQQ
jgi:hypothetical protein